MFLQKLIKEDVGFERGISALKSINSIKHKSIELLNYCCASYIERSVMKNQQIENIEDKLVTLVTGLAAAKHKNIFWKNIQRVFTDNDHILNYHHKTLLLLAANLIVLDFYPVRILEKLFNTDYDYSQESYLNWTFVKIYQSIKTNPNYNGPMPKESQIESFKKMHEITLKHRQNIDLPLEKYLEKSLGGSQYVTSNVATKLFHSLGKFENTLV